MLEAIPRRDFLRGLAALPQIGGAVATIGRPTATASPSRLPLMASHPSTRAALVLSAVGCNWSL